MSNSNFFKFKNVDDVNSGYQNTSDGLKNYIQVKAQVIEKWTDILF